jgi:nucleoside-diphosphate-sugar epimerase
LIHPLDKAIQVKLLLTGATGYIGSHLAHSLIAEGHELSILVRPDSSLDALTSVLPEIQVFIYDGSFKSILCAVKTSKPCTVCHVASLFLAKHQPDDVSRLIESNLNFPVQLLEVMSQEGVKQLINSGTSWQHYENASYNPVNLSAATKHALEALLAYYVEAKEFRSVTLKLFDTFGPGDKRHKLFFQLRNIVRSNGALSMSRGQQILDMVYISDVIAAFLLAIKKLPNVRGSESYAVSNPQRHSLKVVVQMYEEVVGQRLAIDWGGLPYREREVLTPWSSYETLPGWAPQIDLRQGITYMEQDPRINGLLSGFSY